MAKHLTISNKDINSLNINSTKGRLAGLLSGSTKTVKVEEIQTAEPFVSLFLIKEEVLNAIIENMRRLGYDSTQPVIVWKEKNVLIDGHTRLKAAREAGITTIPVICASFGNEEAVLDYMHRLQFNRRNVTDAELIRLIMNALPQYEKKYGEGSKAEFLTKRFTGLSEAKAKQAVIVVEKATREEIQRIENEQYTIRQIYYRIKEDKNTPKQKVTRNFFEDDGERQIIRVDENGNFYFRNYETKKEIKAFSLPKIINRSSIRKRILEIVKEEISQDHLSKVFNEQR